MLPCFTKYLLDIWHSILLQLAFSSFPGIVVFRVTFNSSLSGRGAKLYLAKKNNRVLLHSGVVMIGVEDKLTSEPLWINR